MAHILNRLVNGSASTFNKQTNVRLDNKYTVLDISFPHRRSAHRRYVSGAGLCLGQSQKPTVQKKKPSSSMVLASFYPAPVLLV